jgi:hypothetical protein
MTIARNCDAYERGMTSSLEVHAITLTSQERPIGCGSGCGFARDPQESRAVQAFTVDVTIQDAWRAETARLRCLEPGVDQLSAGVNET